MITAPQATRESGLRQLESFVPNAGARYAKSRNFDFGPERRANVSVLSPYTRHRLVLEEEILSRTLGHHSLSAASKFVQEVFWRAYFKGWLEHRPSVWDAYRSGVTAELVALEQSVELLERYESATTGATSIDCFDAWAQELVRTGYLHNHARMWFASIWVYTLQLPWQLGADFFLRHLIDGDPASNTLSWRWVCGLHTRGKTYLARVSNIVNYTDGRFNPQGQLAVSAPPLAETRAHPARDLPPRDRLPDQGRVGLLVTEEDCSPELLEIGVVPTALLGFVAARQRSPLPIGIPAYDFAKGAVADALARASRHYQAAGELVETESWGAALADWAAKHQLDAVVTAYAPVGPVAELLNAAQPSLERLGIRLVQTRRRYDDVAWPHARRGYFKLKENIPAILGSLAIAGERPAHDDELQDIALTRPAPGEAQPQERLRS